MKEKAQRKNEQEKRVNEKQKDQVSFDLCLKKIYFS